jgi:hypothetical protein
MLCLYIKGRSHQVPSESDPTNILDCAVVLVPHNDDRLALLAKGVHFDTVDELHAPPKPKKTRAKAGEKAVESEDETEAGAPEDEDENTAD